jgi:hypothetical protein
VLVPSVPMATELARVWVVQSVQYGPIAQAVLYVPRVTYLRHLMFVHSARSVVLGMFVLRTDYPELYAGSGSVRCKTACENMRCVAILTAMPLL